MDEDEEPIGQWDDSNRAFVQAFMARGTMTFKQAKPVLAAIFNAGDDRESDTQPEDVTLQDFESYLAAATRVLSPFDYEIRSTIHQVSKDRIYAFVNSSSDPMTQIATTRSTEEIAYIKRLLDAMFEKYNTPRQEIMGVTSMQALKIARAPRPDRESIDGAPANGESQAAPDKGLTSSQAEQLLDSLVAEGWLERSKEGWFTLSARALIELRNWLVAAYNDPDAEPNDWQRIKFCEACRDIVTIGQRCSEPECNARLHDICHVAYWRSRSGKRCPKCGKAWDGLHWVGEKAVTTTAAYLQGRRISKGSRRSQVVEEEVEEEVEEAAEEEEEGEEDDDETE